jgi:DNA replication protein DnaC/transposase
MYGVDLYRRVRLACHREGLSRREASRQFGIDRKTVAKILLHSEPPGYRRREPPKRPKLAPFTAIIDRILEEDRTVHRKQRHTAKRIFERLRDEHGFTGKQTIVKDYVRERRLRLREMFVPLAHAPGHAQADFGEADAIIAGVLHRAHFFVMTLPHSDACFVAAYPAATTEAWLDGHNAAFAFFGGVPRSILYDNDKCLVSRILPDGTRQRTRSFSGLQSHYLFEDRYGRPGKGNDKGNVEGVVGYARRNFMTPRPRFASWDAFNAYLEEQCRKRQGDVVRGHRETIGERLRRDCEALMVLPPAPFDACDRQGTRVSSLSLVYEPVGGRRVMTDTPQLLLAHHLKTLRLPTFLREYDKLARQCAAEGADHVRYLVRLAELELIDRERRMVERRIRQARFPAVKSLDAFDFKALPSLNKMLVVELARCEYVERRENIIALGNSGTGKTHIALGLGLAACQKGLSVGFTTAAALVHELMEARDEKRLLRFQKQLAKYSLLIIDELGFVPLSKTGAELLFEVFSQRYERGATLVTSNLPFDEWTEIFGSERLTGALLDRLTHHVHILEMNGESYRLNQSQKRGKSPKTPA